MNPRLMFVNLLMWCVAAGRAPPPPVKPHRDVVTIQGVVRGYFNPRPPHYAYLGLPYGRPPTYRDRFKAPVAPDRWDGVFVATHRVKCPQPGVDEVDFNCLTVNVFVPQHAASLPVLVHFHDGDFRNGWGSYQPPERLMRQGFVIVTFNYRLGIFGFLCLGTPGIPGNAGLKDQVAALYWIYRNIAKFGGNPHDVILYGTGSGAVSVEVILLSGVAKGLFQRAILESGSSLSPLSMTYDSLSIAFDVAIKLGYTGTKKANELTKFYLKARLKNLINVTEMFLPCIEKDSYISSLLQKDPILILREDNFHHIPLLFVYSKINTITITGKDINKLKVTPHNFESLLPNNLEFDIDKVKHKIADLVKDFYFKEGSQNENVTQFYMDYMNDIFCEYPIVKSAILHASRSEVSVYLMKFSYNQKNVVDFFFSKDDMLSTDREVAEKLTTLWSNFIKFGDPTPLSTSLIPMIWQPVEHLRQSNGSIKIVNYLLFNNSLTMGTLSSIQQLKLWDYIYNRFYKIHESI